MRPPRVFLSPLAACIACASLAQADAELRVTVVLERPATGSVRIALCPDQRAYESEQGCEVRSVPASAGEATATFTGLATGSWAIKVFHDVNDNGTLDTNWIGWPLEPFGFGNNAPVRMGPPPFSAAAVQVKAGENAARVVLRGG